MYREVDLEQSLEYHTRFKQHPIIARAIVVMTSAGMILACEYVIE